MRFFHDPIACPRTMDLPLRLGWGGLFALGLCARLAMAGPLPGTEPLTLSGDIASNLVAGVDRFLLRELDRSVERRSQYWQPDFSSGAAYATSASTNRHRLAHILGLRDARPATNSFLVAGDLGGTAPLARADRYEVFAVRWAAFGDVEGEGLLLRPRFGPPIAAVVAVPDADQTPEDLAGLTSGETVSGGATRCQAFARRLAESGCLVVIPSLISRQRGESKATDAKRAVSLSTREFLYRPAFELGRHLIGYEVQKILSAVDCLMHENELLGRSASSPEARIGVLGWGEGGLLALHAGALDERLVAVGVSGYFGPREGMWQEPVERNVFDLLERFGDAEVASLVAPRALVVEAARGPELEVAPGTDAAPGRLQTPTVSAVQAAWAGAQTLLARLLPSPEFALVVSGDGRGSGGSEPALQRFLAALRPGAPLKLPQDSPAATFPAGSLEARQRRQIHQLDRHTQNLLTESPFVRQKFMSRLDTSSPERYAETSAQYREVFYREVIGRFDQPLLPPHPLSRQVYDEPRWAGYEVVLEVFPDVMAYGLLLVPKDLKPGERRPVVVCQHGLEGRPQDVVKGDQGAYHDFAAKLADQGFITFAPQNLYLFGDRFRTLQRKANPLGKTLFSIIVPQHQQITDWLKTLPFVDPARIGFYGLSYGGKTAMRVPALVQNYCLSICSADFNEWVWKNASTRSPYSYAWMNEYEIFEWDLGSTFNYAEMAALIAPRPFMVERGHFDGVAPDESVAYEFAKVRHLYEARLGLGDRCEIEWFVGPHTINGKGTYDFLHRHLKWP